MTNDVKISQKYKVTVLKHCSLDFYERDIGFILTKMPLKLLALYILYEISFFLRSKKFCKITNKLITDVHRVQQTICQELIQTDREAQNIYFDSLLSAIIC